MLDHHRAASDINRLMGLKVKTEPPTNGTLISSVSLGTPSSPSKARANFGRQMPFFIGVAGGTASGKTTVCDHIMQRLHDQCVVMLSQDSFYRGLTEHEHHNAHCESLIILSLGVEAVAYWLKAAVLPAELLHGKHILQSMTMCASGCSLQFRPSQCF